MALTNGPNLGVLINGALGEAHYAELMRAWRAYDALIMPRAKDKDLNAPPGSPADGDTYVVGTVPTGLWATHANKIARWSAVLATPAWEFYLPKEGWEIWLEDEDKRYRYSGSAWAEVSGGGGGQPLDATLTALAGLATGADTLPYFTGTDAAAQTALTSFARTLLDDANAAAALTTLTAIGSAEKGAANGVAPLAADSKIATTYLPASILGKVEYKGTWDATTAAPAIGAGWYYIVSVAGSTNLSGITDWKVGDWAIYDSAAWSKVDNTDAVSSVAGLVGIISTAALRTALASATLDTIVSFDDVTTKRTGAPTTGYYYFGNTGNRFLGWDGAKFVAGIAAGTFDLIHTGIPSPTFTGTVTGNSLKASGAAGNEGGEITLARPVSGTVFTSDVSFDVINSSVRIFAANGTAGGSGGVIFGMTGDGIFTAWTSGNFNPALKADISTVIGRHMMPVSARAIQPSATGGCSAVTTIATAAGQPDIVSVNFDAVTAEYAQFSIPMPESWNEGTITVQFVWSHGATAGAFGTVWGIQAVAVSNNETLAQGFGTGLSVVDTGGITNQQYISPMSAALTIGGTPAAGDTVYFRVYRDPGSASDTMGIDARLQHIRIYMNTTTGVD